MVHGTVYEVARRVEKWGRIEKSRRSRNGGLGVPKIL